MVQIYFLSISLCHLWEQQPHLRYLDDEQDWFRCYFIIIIELIKVLILF